MTRFTRTRKLVRAPLCPVAAEHRAATKCVSSRCGWVVQHCLVGGVVQEVSACGKLARGRRDTKRREWRSSMRADAQQSSAKREQPRLEVAQNPGRASGPESAMYVASTYDVGNVIRATSESAIKDLGRGDSSSTHAGRSNCRFKAVASRGYSQVPRGYDVDERGLVQ